MQEELAAWTISGDVVKMGTQALWCTQCPSNCFAAEHSGTGLLSHTASSVEEFEYEGQASSGIPQKRVPIGPDFQAELPRLILSNSKTGCNSDCEVDSLRWVGVRVWPQHEGEMIASEEWSRSCPSACSCAIQDTMECVKLHIKEKREALKNELGDAFFVWGFDEMGETVAEHWTHEENLTFQELVRRNPVSFWPDLFEAFPSKCMTDLVSYYFNVFVLRRRAIQNRVNPDNIDSDDDEMVLDSDEKGSESMLESDESDDESQVESQVDDAVCEDDEENCSMDWPVKDSSEYEKIQEKSGFGENLHVVDTTGQKEVSAESSLRACDIQEPMKSVPKESSDCCCDVSNQADRVQAIKPWEMLSWDRANHSSSNQCVIEQCEREVWSSPTLLSTQEDVDKLISTKGMMEEFFGSDIWEARK